MSMLVKKSVILVKAETTFGTDPTPDGTNNSIIVSDIDIKENIAPVERNAHWAYLGQIPSLKGEQYSEVTFKVDVYHSGTAGTPARIGALLKACGLSETAGATVVYAPTSSSIGSCTIYVYKDGRQHIISGCRGNAKFTWKAGNFLQAEFSMKGTYTAPTVVANPACTYESTAKTPPVCLSSAFSYNSKTTLITASVELDFGNTLAKKVSLSAASGITGFEITERKPTCVIDPECQVETSYTFRTDMLGGASRALSVVATRAAGNIITLAVPYYNITKIEYADREGILVEKIEGECAESSGNDSYSITFS